MKNLLVYSVSFLILTLSSCQIGECGLTKDQFLTNHDKLVDEVKVQSKSELKEKWDKYDKKMDRMIMECFDRYEKDMNDEEKLSFWLSSVAFYVKRHGFKVLNKFDEKEDEVFVKIGENLEDLDEDIEIDGKKLFEDLTGEDLDELMEDLVDDIEKWGERFKEMFGIEEE